MADEDLRAEAERHLRALAGAAAELRDDQWRAIEALVAQRRRALVVQRTGWGKSAVYFIATALLRARGAGATVIVSPLLSLMRNQIAAAERAGIRARTINSSNIDEWRDVERAVDAGDVDVLLVSPERLNNPGFRDAVLPRLAAETGLLVVDEAHCISDWGHDFRPDYRRIATLLRDLPEGIPVLATTATANERVVADVAEQMDASANGPTLVLRGSLDRESLQLGVISLPTGAHRLAWLGEHLADLPGSGIIYTLTVSQADEVAAFLRTRGYRVAAYSGRTETADRLAAEDDLLANRVKALVATSALGMGFDKPDLGFVVHLGAPASPIAYYQQVGRAGRGVAHASVLLLPGHEDADIWSYFDSVGFPPESLVRRTLKVLDDAGRPMSTAALEVSVDLNRSRLDAMLKVLDVDGAVRRMAGGWVVTGAEWVYDAERYERVAAARRAEQQAMRDYISTGACRLEFLRRQLDDPGAAPCGRCDNCVGPFWSTNVTDEAIQNSIAELRRPGVAVEPRRMWPTGLAATGLDFSGKIASSEQAENGKALGRLSDIGWGPRLRVLLHDDAPDRPVADEILAALVEVLRTWDWERRPTVVATVPSARRGRLLTTTGEKLAEIGKLRWLGQLEQPNPLQRKALRSNSAHRVRALHGTFGVTSVQREVLSGGDQVVLLIDDLIDSGWTMALAARELRLAGALAVLPLAFGLQA
ncbi:MAG: RecQ family ATP-dependent DNA helicase [Acidothermaceae bacterium]